MKTIVSFLAMLLLALAMPSRAAPAAGVGGIGEDRLLCNLHITAAVHESTRFTDDGATHLVWEDSLGRRTRAELRADGAVVLRLPDGRVKHHPPSTRLPSEQQVARVERVLAAYRERGVDLVGRRFIDPAAAPAPTPPDSGSRWDNRDGIWVIVDACEKAERAARDTCTFECGQEGMTGFYKPGECGAGSSCSCGYVLGGPATL